MPTWTALTTLSSKSRAEALAETLETIEPAPTGIGTFEVEDGSGTWEVGAYFTEAPNEVALALLAGVAAPQRDDLRRELKWLEAFLLTLDAPLATSAEWLAAPQN